MVISFAYFYPDNSGDSTGGKYISKYWEEIVYVHLSVTYYSMAVNNCQYRKTRSIIVHDEQSEEAKSLYEMSSIIYN